MGAAQFQKRDQEASSAQTAREAKARVPDSDTPRFSVTQNAERQEERWEALRDVIGSVARPEVQESETLRARIAGELRLVGRLKRIALPVALVVFALLAVLAALQLYTWTRLEELTAQGQQREKQAAATQAAMQETINKQRAALDQVGQKVPSVGQSNSRANLPAKESEERGTASPVRTQPKHAQANKEPQAEHRAAPSPGTEQPVAEQHRSATVRQTSASRVSAGGQEFTVVYPSPSAIPPDLAANRQGVTAAPSGQDLSAQQGLETVQNEQHEGAGSSGVKLSQPEAAIARDHNEIENLRKLGKRDYVEFTLVRSGARQEVAPDISLQLRKVDSKRLRCRLNIYAEGYEFPTELALNEPVVFPIRAMWESVELVINQMGKDTVVGYISTRKGVLEGGR